MATITKTLPNINFDNFLADVAASTFAPKFISILTYRSSDGELVLDLTTALTTGEETELDNLITNHDNTPAPVPSDWQPPQLSLGSFNTSGVTIYNAVGSGYLFTFDPSQNDEIIGNLELDPDGIRYTGDEILIHLHWQIFSAPAADQNVKWELDYAFVSDGEENYTVVDGTITLDVTVDSRNAQEQYTDAFAAISGEPGASVLQLTLRRKGAGPGSDTYPGDADLYSVGIEKV